MKKKNLLMTAIAIIGLATITRAQVPSYVPTTGLVGWWPFNGNANDESGNGNNGTVNGATLTTDRNGSGNSAYSFDGVNDYILSPGGANYINDSLTISFWIYNTTNSFSNTELICIGSSSSTYYGVVCTNLGTRLNYARGCGETTQTNANSPFSLNTWNHIVIRSFAAPNQTEVYLNGNFQGYASNSNPAGCSNSNLYFGVDIFSVAEYYLGLLDDIGIWNRALTPQEITDLFNGCQFSVNTQPTNQTINVNNNAQFVVSSTDPNATYQWQTDLGVGFQNLNNVGQYSGTTNDTLNIANVTMSNNNQPFRCIISSGSCADTSNVAVLTVNNNVGINEYAQDNLFSVFPNPAQSVINIKSDTKLIGEIYSIYDNTGKVVLTGILKSENTTIDLGNISGGIYLFSVGENMKQSFKVIKE
jgi:hypothetical protein